MNKKLEWDLTVLTDYVMGGTDELRANSSLLFCQIKGGRLR